MVGVSLRYSHTDTHIIEHNSQGYSSVVGSGFRKRYVATSARTRYVRALNELHLSKTPRFDRGLNLGFFHGSYGSNMEHMGQTRAVLSFSIVSIVMFE